VNKITEDYSAAAYVIDFQNLFQCVTKEKEPPRTKRSVRKNGTKKY